MKKFYNNVPAAIKILLVVTLLKEIVFSAIIPIWHTPDEQAHFAQTAYFAENNKMPHNPPDLNKEILMSERLLGTERDDQGNNKFTFHPEYRIEYTNTTAGKYEEVIASFPSEFRTNFIKQEAAYYPPLYYWVTGVAYKAFYKADLISRVYAGRFVSIIMFMLTVFLAWLIGKQVFPKNELYQFLLPVLVSFQPMFSFVGAGVTSDNLLNLLFTVIIYLSLLLINKGPKIRLLLATIVAFVLLYLTKPQFILSIPILALALIGWFILNSNFTRKRKLSIEAGIFILLLAVVMLIVSTPIYGIIERYYPQSFFPGDKKVLDISFWQFFRQTLSHTIAEVIPWYWGVFDWLGVTLPREVHRVINRLMILAAIGVLVKLVLMVRKRAEENWLFIFMLAITAIYFLGITYYNYMFAVSHGYPFGIQGRYYFPVIVPQMAILLVGLSSLIPDKLKKVNQIWILLIGLGMIILNFVALWVIAGTYYDLSSINTFIIQASQYKPLFFKGNLLAIWIIIYLLSLAALFTAIWKNLRRSGFNLSKS